MGKINMNNSQKAAEKNMEICVSTVTDAQSLPCENSPLQKGQGDAG